MLAIECERLTKRFVERREKEPEAKAPAGQGTNGQSGQGADGKAGQGRAGLSRLWRQGLWRPGRVERREVVALDGVSLSVPRGEIFGIIGPNGSGKSTLIRIIATLLIPDSGTVRVFGKDALRQRQEVRRMMNRVSVEAAFFKKLSAMENLSYAARLYDLPIGEARRQAMEILARLGLRRDQVTVPLEDLSRGMQQKVAIARAFLTSPVLLLLDEPTTGLDPKSRRDVQDFVLQVREQHDATVVLTTHDMAEAERLCDRVALIDRGRFLALDTPAGLKQAVAGQSGGKPVTMEDVFFAVIGSDWKPPQPEEAAEVGEEAMVS